MPNFEYDASTLEKIKELKQAYKEDKNAEKVDKSENEIEKSSGDANTAQYILNRYKSLKKGLTSKDITIEKLDKSLDNMQSLMIYAFEQSERELTDKKSHVGKFFNRIQKAGKSVGTLLGVQGTYSASNIKKVFDEIRAEKIANQIKKEIQKTPLSEFGTKGQMLDANYYVGGTVTIDTYLNERLPRYLNKKLIKLQTFFGKYAHVGIKNMKNNDANNFKSNYPITSALIRVTSGLAGISTKEKPPENQIDIYLSKNSPLHFLPKKNKKNNSTNVGYIGSFICNVFDIIAMAMRISNDQNFQQNMDKSFGELLKEFDKKELGRRCNLAPSKALKSEAERLEKEAKSYYVEVSRYEKLIQDTSAKLEKLKREKENLEIKADSLRKEAERLKELNDIL